MSNFFEKAKALYYFQLENNTVFRTYVNSIGTLDKPINSFEDFTFLPIAFFKSHEVKSYREESKLVFESSGTTGEISSKHFILNPEIYHQSTAKCFEDTYGKIEDFCFLGLLPGYLERPNSSLVYMLKRFIEKSRFPQSNFYIRDHKLLYNTLQEVEQKKIPTILIGVSYALLDFMELIDFQLMHTIVMETGGMKGTRKEMVKKELHETLKKGFGLEQIHSEFGMTELLSQCYSKEKGLFKCPGSLKVFARSISDPFQILSAKQQGALNIIDLANQDSCAFIETQDIGTCIDADYFEIHGRLDNADLRGCNLMIS